jgi:hypothetical protein
VLCQALPSAAQQHLKAMLDVPLVLLELIFHFFDALDPD